MRWYFLFCFFPWQSNDEGEWVSSSLPRCFFFFLLHTICCKIRKRTNFFFLLLFIQLFLLFFALIANVNIEMKRNFNLYLFSLDFKINNFGSEKRSLLKLRGKSLCLQYWFFVYYSSTYGPVLSLSLFLSFSLSLSFSLVRSLSLFGVCADSYHLCVYVSLDFFAAQHTSFFLHFFVSLFLLYMCSLRYLHRKFD